MRVEQNREEEAFARNVEGWVTTAIEAGASDFDSLLKLLPSVYPTMVLPALTALLAKGQINSNVWTQLQPTVSTARLPGAARGSLLPVPHPLNFEWRFSTEGSRLLLDLTDEIARPNDTVLLLGTPGVALEALTRSSALPTVFFGEDNPVTRRIIALNDAAGRPLCVQFCSGGGPVRRGAGVVIVDPPWYLDFVRPMLATAAGSCSIGGYILISLPPVGTRPSAMNDRDWVLALAERLGLRTAATHPLALIYETPFFEFNALRATGIQVQNFWRRGDLIVFQKIFEVDRPIITGMVRKERWSDIEIGRLRLFIRRDAPAVRAGSLDSLVEGDVLPTVSRRDHRRARAQVWTSGNRIFASSTPELVISAAVTISHELFGTGALPSLCYSIEERDEVRRLGCVLRTLVAVEAEEEQAAQAATAVGWNDKWTSTLTASNKVLLATSFGQAISTTLSNQ